MARVAVVVTPLQGVWGRARAASSLQGLGVQPLWGLVCVSTPVPWAIVVQEKWFCFH